MTDDIIAPIVEPITTEAQSMDIRDDHLTAQYKEMLDKAKQNEQSATVNDNIQLSQGQKEGGKEGGVAGEGGKEEKKEDPGFKKKFRLKIERFSRMVADGERFAYNKMKAPYKAEYGEETKEDIDEIIQNRLTVMSEYGDILNLVFDLVGHAVDSGLEVRQNAEIEKETQISKNVKNSKWF